MVFIDERLYNILSLSLVFGCGSQKAVKIYLALKESNRFGITLKEALKGVDIDGKSRERLLGVNERDIEKIIGDCGNNGIRILPIYDECYPECLRNISVPPLVLFIKGTLPDFDNQPAFCIVGPRKITEFGYKAAYSLARRLAKSGMIIISGSAAGGDYAAHTGALSAGGRCVMVLADGIVTEMNSKNHKLCDSILKDGCIISETLPGDKARKYSFPIRNRIMSGLGLGVAVVEAPEKSGTLITANHAAEQGRDVFVVPGNPADPAYKGSNSLLRDGAIPLIDASDIFTRYIADFPEKINIQKAFEEKKDKPLKKNLQKKSLCSLSKEAQIVYNNLAKPEFTADDLIVPELDTGSILSALTELEIEHLIISIPGGTYKISDQ